MNLVKWNACFCSEICRCIFSILITGLLAFSANAQDPPTAFHVISLDGANELAWQPPTVSAGITEYHIYRSTDSVTFTPLANVPFGANTYTDNGLTNGQFYFYAVRSFDGSTEGDFSTVDASTPEDGFNSFIRFDGSAHGVVSDSLYLGLDNDIGERSFSVEFWVRINDIGYSDQTIVIREQAYTGGPGKEVYYKIRYSSGKFSAYRYTAGQAVETNPATLPINENQWYHLTFTFNEPSNKCHLYVDGQDVVPGGVNSFLPNENKYARLFVGGETLTRDDATKTYTMYKHFRGDICELRLWNKFRSEAEVQADLYNRLRGDEDPKLYGVWHFDRMFNHYTYSYGIAELNTSHSPSTPFSPGYENIKLFNAKVVSPEIDAVDDAVNVHTNAINDVLDVQGNDVFNESYLFHSIVVTPPEHGTALVSGNTDILYTPTPGYLGNDSIQYLVIDSTFFTAPHRFADTAWVNINVYNNPPVITSNGGGDDAATSINENTTAVTTVTATDVDAGSTLTYTITGGADQALFKINSSTGALVFDPAPDFENPTDSDPNNEYVVVVEVSDGVNTDQQTLTITVLDVIEIANFNIDNITDTDVDENLAYTSVTPNLINAAPIGNVTYTISGGADAADFTIDASTGVVEMIARNFEDPDDDNEDNVYEIEITATDDDGNADAETWAVRILDVIEIANFNIDNIADTDVDENLAYTSVTPNLINAAPIGNVTYTISGGADAADFTIDASTGVVEMIARNFEDPDDADTDNVYEIEITATDDDGNADTETWAVRILDVIEIANFNIDNIADTDVDENLAYTSVTPNLINAAPIGNVTYTISGGADAADFTIDASTGVVEMTARNFEDPDDDNEDNVYEIEITATDDDGNSDAESWAVRILDVIEIANFNIDNITDTDVDENLAYTSVTPNLINAAPIGNVTYTISGGADAADFTIDASTGVVEMTARNFEDPDDDNEDNVYEIEITATDDDGNSDAESWLVRVLDVAESATFTIKAISDTIVNENTVYTLAPPPSINGTPIGSITYSITGGDDDDFTIDSHSGVVSMAARNFESPADGNTDNVYEIEITVEDIDGNRDSESWTVTVVDVLEAATFTIDNISDSDVDENLSYTSVAPSLGGDTPIGNITYSISGGDDADDFTIEATTGQVSMDARDFEDPDDNNEDNAYEIAITATDDDNNSATLAWTVTVTDVNDNPPIITSDGGGDNATIHMDEKTIAVTTVTATDADAISILTFSITGGDDQALFTIDETGGDLAFNIAPDFANPTDSDGDNAYRVIVSTSDGTFIDEQILMVIVDEVNGSPVDLSLSQNTVVENESVGTLVGTFSTDDNDTGDTHIYTIEGGVDAASFSITGDELTTNESFDFESKNNYEILVRTTNAGGNFFEKTFQIVVLDANDAPTSIYLSNNTIVEEAQPGTLIGLLSTIDEDVGDIHQYRIVGGLDSALFLIRDNQLLTRSTFDFDLGNIFRITIRSTDSGGEFIERDFEITLTPDPGRGLTIPSAFTPNNDDINDLWIIPEIDRYPNCRVLVMHRNGQKIFQSKGYQTPWDGTSHNKVLGEGTYFYIIELNDDLHRVYTGFVMIL